MIPELLSSLVVISKQKNKLMQDSVELYWRGFPLDCTCNRIDYQIINMSIVHELCDYCYELLKWSYIGINYNYHTYTCCFQKFHIVNSLLYNIIMIIYRNRINFWRFKIS